MTEAEADRRRAGLAALCAALFYLPSLGAAFQFDDYNVIVGDPAARGWRAWLSGLPAGLRPLLKATYVFCWRAGGGGPLAFHAFNLAVHALNAALVYLLGRRLCARWLGEEKAAGPALAAALLFALHPAQTEAVTYACGRSQSLMACFYLAAVLAYLEGASAWAAAGLLACAAAVKETALTLPAALLLVECFARQTPLREDLRRQAPVWLSALGAFGLMLGSARYRRLLAYGFSQRGPFSNALTQLNGLWYLLARLATLRGLNIDPGLPVLSAWTPALAARAAALCGLLALALAARRKRPELAFGALWFCVSLAPTNSVIPRLDPANDRQLYLACWGPLLSLCVTAARALPPRAARAGAAVLAALFAAASLARQRDYASETALWQASVEQNPANARARNNLGLAYQEAGRRRQARAQFERALSLRPGYLRAAVNLRLLDWDEASRRAKELK